MTVQLECIMSVSLPNICNVLTSQVLNLADIYEPLNLRTYDTATLLSVSFLSCVIAQV